MPSTLRQVGLPLLLHIVLFLGLFQLGFSPLQWSELHRLAMERGVPLQQVIEDEYGPLGLLGDFYFSVSDEYLYREYARLTLEGKIDLRYLRAKRGSKGGGKEQGSLPARAWPYRDVIVEYPPGALLGIIPPGLLSDSYRGYRFWLGAWMLLLHLLNLVLALKVFHPPAVEDPPGQDRQEDSRRQVLGRLLWWSLGFSLLLGCIMAQRIDHLVVTWMLLSMLTFSRCLPRGDGSGEASTRWAAAFGVVTGLGVMTKIVPGMVMPAAMLIFLLRADLFRSRRGLLAGAALLGLAATLVLINAGLLALAGEKLWQIYTYHAARGIQLESLYGGLIILAHLAGSPVSVDFAFGSHNVESILSGPALVSAPLAFVLLALLVAVQTWRGRQQGMAALLLQPAAGLGALTLVLLLAFVLTNKVLSPQYLIWFGAPLLSLAVSRTSMRLPAALLLGVAGLTQVIFPRCYELLVALHPALVLVLNARNVLLVVLFILLVRRLPHILEGPAPPAGGAHWRK